MKQISVKTTRRIEAVDITGPVARAVEESKVKEGVVTVYVPHTTAGVTINEGADPDVMRDVMEVLTRMAPASGAYRHLEGNADSHVKATITGSSVSVIVHNGKLMLGTWQKIFFMEFDGPRHRQVYIKVLSD